MNLISVNKKLQMASEKVRTFFFHSKIIGMGPNVWKLENLQVVEIR